MIGSNLAPGTVGLLWGYACEMHFRVVQGVAQWVKQGDCQVYTRYFCKKEVICCFVRGKFRRSKHNPYTTSRIISLLRGRWYLKAVKSK